MEIGEFIAKLAEALEMEQGTINIDTNFRSLDTFDSMSIMTLIAFADEHFSKKFTAKQLSTITTVRSLMELIGMGNFDA